MARRSSTTVAVALDVETRVCVLFGEEEMLKHEHLEQLRSAIKTKHGEADTLLFDGPTAALADVLDELRTYALMPVFKVVIVDEADEFVKRPGHREALERYVQAPADQAVLVLRSTQWRPGNIDKLIAKVGAVLKCDPLTAEAAQTWITRRAIAVHGCKITPKAGALLVDRLGADLMRLDSETAKLAVLAGEGRDIDVDLVEELVGKSNDEKAWAVQDALLSALEKGRNLNLTGRTAAGEVIEKIHELVDLAGHDEVPVSYAMADLMRKLCHAAALKRRGGSDYQIPRQVGFFGPHQSRFMAVVKKIDMAKARRWYQRLLENDLRVRNGLGQPLRNLECFCAVLADEM